MAEDTSRDPLPLAALALEAEGPPRDGDGAEEESDIEAPGFAVASREVFDAVKADDKDAFMKALRNAINLARL